MASYTKRKLKNCEVWDVRFRMINAEGLEVQKRLAGFAKKSDAQAAYVKFMSTYLPPERRQENQDSGITFEDAVKIFKPYYAATVSEPSYYDFENIFARFITPSFKGRKIKDLDKKMLYAWQDKIFLTKKKDGQRYAKKYLKKIRSTLSVFLIFCEERFEVQNWLPLVKFPKIKDAHVERKVWTLAQFSNFIAGVDEVFWNAFFSVLFFSGARPGEVLALAECDYTAGKLKIGKSLSNKVMDRAFLIKEPKTADGYRTVNLPTVCVEKLDKFIAWKRESKMTKEFLFCNGNNPIHGNTYRKAFNRYLSKCTEDKIIPYELRHSNISMLKHFNIDMAVVAERVGHSDPTFTTKTYSHLYKDDHEKALEKYNTELAQDMAQKT